MAQMNLTDVDLPSLTSALDRLLLDLRRSTQEDGGNVGTSNGVGRIGNPWGKVEQRDEMMIFFFQYDHAKGSQRKAKTLF